MRDIQDFLSARLGRRAIRLEIIERAQNAFVSPIRDRSLFRNATLVLEVAARRPLVEIQNDFPHLFKIGPNTKMNEIVHANLPGVPLVHLPTPPPHIRAITDHVYFYLDRKSQLWPEFSTAASIGMHFSGDWPELDCSFGRSWKTVDERQGQTGKPVWSGRSDDHSAQSGWKVAEVHLYPSRRKAIRFPTVVTPPARAVFADARMPVRRSSSASAPAAWCAARLPFGQPLRAGAIDERAGRLDFKHLCADATPLDAAGEPTASGR